MDEPKIRWNIADLMCRLVETGMRIVGVVRADLVVLACLLRGLRLGMLLVLNLSMRLLLSCVLGRMLNVVRRMLRTGWYVVRSLWRYLKEELVNSEQEIERI